MESAFPLKLLRTVTVLHVRMTTDYPSFQPLFFWPIFHHYFFASHVYTCQVKITLHASDESLCWNKFVRYYKTLRCPLEHLHTSESSRQRALPRAIRKWRSIVLQFLAHKELWSIALLNSDTFCFLPFQPALWIVFFLFCFFDVPSDSSINEYISSNLWWVQFHQPCIPIISRSFICTEVSDPSCDPSRRGSRTSC